MGRIIDMKIKRGFFGDIVEVEFNPLTDNQFNHFEGKNDDCLYCSSWKAPECPLHDNPKKLNSRKG